LFYKLYAYYISPLIVKILLYFKKFFNKGILCRNSKGIRDKGIKNALGKKTKKNKRFVAFISNKKKRQTVHCLTFCLNPRRVCPHLWQSYSPGNHLIIVVAVWLNGIGAAAAVCPYFCGVYACSPDTAFKDVEVVAVGERHSIAFSLSEIKEKVLTDNALSFRK
jgi:hypothetical protein